MKLGNTRLTGSWAIIDWNCGGESTLLACRNSSSVRMVESERLICAASGILIVSLVLLFCVWDQSRRSILSYIWFDTSYSSSWLSCESYPSSSRESTPLRQRHRSNSIRSFAVGDRLCRADQYIASHFRPIISFSSLVHPSSMQRITLRSFTNMASESSFSVNSTIKLNNGVLMPRIHLGVYM